MKNNGCATRGAVGATRRSREKIDNPCHSEPVRFAQGKLREESAVVCFQEDKCRCFAKFTLSEQTADPSLRSESVTFLDFWPFEGA
jgi:hypothetical protein